MLNYAVKLTFTEPILGSLPQRDIFENHCQLKAIEKGVITEDQAVEESKSVPEMVDKGTTAFARDPSGNLCVFDYALKAYIKHTTNTLSKGIGIKQAKDKLTKYLFVLPRMVPFLDEAGNPLKVPDDFNTRPMRVDTAQGPRVCLARSEQVNAGRTLAFRLAIIEPNPLGDVDELLKQVFEYGQLMGLGQWRSGSYGRFTATTTKE